MLDSDTKRRINTCRDILVGKVPDPKSQVEQITIALIYKFMDDMDLEAEEMGFPRKFFTGDFERYRWAKLLAPGVGGQEMLNNYSEALTKMVENAELPELFRNIFRNAYLPYRDPETLRSFLREINGFTYDHSERLGDAFEYLLSVLGSQGDAGQFRTPRHVIDFMVEIVDPKKDEVILDPACGTAGFLISSYKHILKANSTDPTSGIGNGAEADAAEATLDSPLRYSGDLLTPEDRQRLASNIKGYDISPDMVRLSLVNLYLHGFADPKVEEYDTLTNEERWGEAADVILANPPFMSPKGGIKPHNRFQVQSKRSEVLFVDYIAEHLSPNGRAAIVVPEGIIFQSQSAYCDLRKMLVDKFLAAVVSLPAGVFNPYSGVKTSILILDRALAKASDSIAFFKIDNDGFGLSAQRRAVKGSQLPRVKAELSAWFAAVRDKGDATLESALGHAVAKDLLAQDGQYNLSGERYRQDSEIDHKVPRVPLATISTINPRKSEISDLPGDTLVSFVPMADLGERRIRFSPREVRPIAEVVGSYTYFADGDVLLAKVTPCFENGKAGVAGGLTNGVGFGSSEFYVLRAGEKALPQWIYHCVMHPGFRGPAIASMTGTGGLQRVPRDFLEKFTIPIPPLEVQREIVAEVEGYQRVIDGARAVLENYKPHIPIDPEWPVTSLGSLADFKNGLNFSKDEAGQPITIVGVSDFQNHLTVPLRGLSTVSIAGEVGGDYLLRGGDIIFVRSNGNPELVGRSMLVPDDVGRVTFSGFTIRARFTRDIVKPKFYAYFFKSEEFSAKIKTVGQGANIRNLSQGILGGLQVPVPPLETQEAIAAEIDAEQALVNGNRELIARFEKKIEASIDRVWGTAEELAAA